MTDRFAIDIETIPVEQNPDFNNPAHWTIFAVALGYTNESMREPDVQVIFREDFSTRSENRALNQSLDWIAERSTRGEERFLITYNGANYDIPILQERARRCRRCHPRDTVVERLFLLLESTDHVDLIQIMKSRKGYFVSLEDSLNEFCIQFDEPEWLGKKITGSDMPSMGLELLSDRPPGANADLRRAVERYAASDVKPLFELDERLRLEEAAMR